MRSLIDGDVEFSVDHEPVLHMPLTGLLTTWMTPTSPPILVSIWALRLYLPSMEILNGTYDIPGINRIR